MMVLGRLKGLLFNAKFEPSSYTATMSTSKLFRFNSRRFLTRKLSLASTANGPEIATFASGCFWGTEHIFLKHFPPAQNKGILKTNVGYTGGNPLVKNPDYKSVCTGATDHAEAVRIEFDPAVVTYDQLVGKQLSHFPPPRTPTHPTPRILLQDT